MILWVCILTKPAPLDVEDVQNILTCAVLKQKQKHVSKDMSTSETKYEDIFSNIIVRQQQVYQWTQLVSCKSFLYHHVSILVRAECVRCPWALLWNQVSTIFGIIFLLSSFFSPPHTFLPEGVVLGL